MPIVRELVTRLRYDVDSRGVRGYRLAVDRAAGAARRATSSIRASGSSAGAASGGIGRAAAALGNLATRASMVNDEIRDAQMARYGRAWQSVTGYIRGANHQVDVHGNRIRQATGESNLLLRAWGAIGTAIAAVSVGRIIDEGRAAEDQIRFFTEGADNQERAYNAIMQIARQTRTQFAASANLFGKLQMSSEQTGYDLEKNLKLTRAINMAAAAGGGTSEGRNAALEQLMQGIQSGTFQGDELRSVREQSPMLAKAIADGLGVNIGDLKQLGSEGKLTASVVSDAIISQYDALSEVFDKSRKSIGDIGTAASNTVYRIARAFDQSTNGITWGINSVIGMIHSMGDALMWAGGLASDVFGGARNAAKFFGYALIAAIGPSALRAVYKMVSGLRAMAAASWASAGPWALIAGAILAALLIGDDLVAWANGAQSVFSGLVGPVTDWKDELGAVYSSFSQIGTSVGNLIRSVRQFASDTDKVVGKGQGEPPLQGFLRTLLETIASINREISSMIDELNRLVNMSTEDVIKGMGDRLWQETKKAFTTLPFTVKQDSPLRNMFEMRDGSALDTFVKGFADGVDRSSYDRRMAAQAGGNVRGGDINVTNHNTITTASGSPGQVGAAVGRATEQSARSWQGLPFLSPNVERAP